MSEEILSEFIDELSKRSDPLPRDLIEKYRRLGLPDSEIAAATMARAALLGPQVPEAAFEKSAGRIVDLTENARRGPDVEASRPASFLRGISRGLRRLLNRES